MHAPSDNGPGASHRCSRCSGLAESRLLIGPSQLGIRLYSDQRSPHRPNGPISTLFFSSRSDPIIPFTSTRTQRMPSQESAPDTAGRPSTVARDEERSAPAYVPDTNCGPHLLGLPRITC